VDKHIHHIQPKYLIGEDNSPDNLTPPILVALHAAFHKDLFEHFGNTEDFLAWKGLLGESLKGCKFTPEVRKKISESNKGKHFKPKTIETKLKMSIACKGRKHSEETKKKISNSEKGKKLSKETKDKIAQSRKGKKFPRTKNGTP